MVLLRDITLALAPPFASPLLIEVPLPLLSPEGVTETPGVPLTVPIAPEVPEALLPETKLSLPLVPLTLLSLEALLPLEEVLPEVPLSLEALSLAELLLALLSVAELSLEALLSLEVLLLESSVELPERWLCMAGEETLLSSL